MAADSSAVRPVPLLVFLYTALHTHPVCVSLYRRGDAWSALQVPATLLLALDRLEQGLEVALAEAERAVPLDQLEEHRRAVLHRLGEDLEQVAVLVAVDQDAQFAQRLDRYPGLAGP